MENKINVLFHLRNGKSADDNKQSIYLRLTIAQCRFEWSTQRFIEEESGQEKLEKLREIRKKQKVLIPIWIY